MSDLSAASQALAEQLDFDALESSWREVAAVGHPATQYFYSHLFLANPELRDMFPISMSAQRDRFFTALGSIVADARRLGTDTEFIRQLGRDHRRYQVIPQHYGAVEDSLVAVLRHVLGARLTDELAHTWSAAYRAVATAMVEAAEADELAAPACWDAEVIASQRRTIEVAVHTLRPTQEDRYLPGQSFAVELPQRPRLWRYYSPANAPRADGTIELHVHAVPGGGVSGLFAREMPIGEKVRIGPPVGTTLTLPAEHSGEVVMVAGGTGLAPLRAVLEQFTRRWRERGTGPRVRLYHGVKEKWHLYDNVYLSELSHELWFDYLPVVSDDPTFPGRIGTVGAAVAADLPWADEGHTPTRTVLVCGSTMMLEATVAELRGAGYPAESIRIEDFGAIGWDDTAPETGSRS